jgi:hypothetical protein
MAEQEQEFVRVKLAGDPPDTIPGRVTRQAFDMIWSHRGYVIVDDEDAALADSPATLAELAGAGEPEAEVTATGGRRSTRKGE